MTIKEAKEYIQDYYKKQIHNEEEEYLIVECLEYLIEQTKQHKYMLHLGGYYYEKQFFDLALKYYNMASNYGNEQADVCLGYIYYYGRCGARDYQKAYEYYLKGMQKGSLVASYKVADLYKNGYYVEKDTEKYKEIIRSLYPKIKNAKYVEEPLPEIYSRLGMIYVEENNITEALHLFLYARDFLASRIQYNPFFGNLTIMKMLIDDIYSIISFDPDFIDLYDLYYLLEKPCKVAFYYQNKQYHIEAMEENNEVVIYFNNQQEGKWYRTTQDFFQKASIEGKLLTELYQYLVDFEVEEWN